MTHFHVISVFRSHSSHGLRCMGILRHSVSATGGYTLLSNGRIPTHFISVLYSILHSNGLILCTSLCRTGKLVRTSFLAVVLHWPSWLSGSFPHVTLAIVHLLAQFRALGHPQLALASWRFFTRFTSISLHPLCPKSVFLHFSILHLAYPCWIEIGQIPMNTNCSEQCEHAIHYRAT